VDWFGRIAVSSKRHARSQIAQVDRVLEKTKPPRGGAALEIGCGAGFVSAHVAETFEVIVTATDADPQMLAVARKKNGSIDNVTFSEADAGALPYGDSEFDLVIAQNVLHHVPDWRKAADEVARVLRPGGLFVLSDITGPSASMKLFSRAKESHGFHDIEELVSRMAVKGLEAVRGDPPGLREFTMLFRKS
jgi:ubiquinone/menaquinone biosynthesis C-methylase UbiE